MCRSPPGGIMLTVSTCLREYELAIWEGGGNSVSAKGDNKAFVGGFFEEVPGQGQHVCRGRIRGCRRRRRAPSPAHPAAWHRGPKTADRLIPHGLPRPVAGTSS